MIIKCMLFYLFLIYPVVSMSQDLDSCYLKDVDGNPVDRLLDDKTAEYITLDGRKVIAYIANGIEFSAGKDSLDNYV